MQAIVQSVVTTSVLRQRPSHLESGSNGMSEKINGTKSRATNGWDGRVRAYSSLTHLGARSTPSEALVCLPNALHNSPHSFAEGNLEQQGCHTDTPLRH